MVSRLLRWSVFAVAIHSWSLPGQSILVGNGALLNGNGSYPTPYGNWHFGSRHQFLVRASELTQAGIPPGPIHAVSFEVSQEGGAALQNFTVRVGHTTLSALSAFAGGLTTVAFAAAFDDRPGWNRHVFAAPFAWDGVRNLVIETCHENPGFTFNAVVRHVATPFAASAWYWVDGAGACSAPGLVGTANQRPNLRFDLSPPVPEFQTNRPGATLLVEGIAAFPEAKAVVPLCFGSVAMVSLSSTFAPGLFDLGVGLRPLVAASEGAVVLSGANVVNLDLGDPLLRFLNGGLVPHFDPFPGAVQASIAVPPLQAVVGAQMVALDASMPQAFALSQASEVQVGIASLPLPEFGTVLEDGFTVHDFGCFSFYGTVHTRIAVCANGRVLFGGTGSTDFTPTVAEALSGPPFAGAWCDLSPQLGGQIALTTPAPGLLRIDWANVPYYGNPALRSSFAIELDGASRVVVLDGLASFPVFPPTIGTTPIQYLGLAAGAPGATDPGPLAFTAGGPFAGRVGRALVYSFGTAGTLVPGLDRLYFVPNASGGYDYFGL